MFRFLFKDTTPPVQSKKTVDLISEGHGDKIVDAVLGMKNRHKTEITVSDKDGSRKTIEIVRMD